MPNEGDPIGLVRAALKLELLDRDLVCRGCGEPFTSIPHMHEGMISRGDVQGWPKDRRVLIFTEYNCILLCRDCNLSLNGKWPPSRERIISEQHALYGPPLIDWLRGLPWKVQPAWIRAWLERLT